MKTTFTMLRTMSQLYADGMSQRMIADALGVSRGSVCYWMKMVPDMFPPREVRDESWWRSKLQEVDGLSDSTAAIKLGCDRHTVWKWRRRIARP